MHIVQEAIGIPRIQTKKVGDFHVVFTMGPLPTGYGVTLGNALRRILLSSLPGSCATAVKFDGVSHEYTTIPGVKESVLDVTLNLKLLNFSKEDTEISEVTIDVSKAGKIYGKDIKCPTGVEVINKDQYICTLEKGANLKGKIRVEKGVGYSPASERQASEEDSATILIDALYSAVKKVRYEINPARVGERTDLDQLVLEIETDGSITPEDAVKFASNVAKSYFELFNMENIMVEEEFMTDVQAIAAKEEEENSKSPAQEAYTPIEILALSPRTLNALINGGIGSIELLTKCTTSKLNGLRGFGKKAADEVIDALAKRDLTLSED